MDRETLSTRKESYGGSLPPFDDRVEVGSFSLDTERRFHHDDSRMRYYAEPAAAPNFDLRDGYGDRYIRRDENLRKNLEHILHWILANKSTLMKDAAGASPLDNFDFVTSRGRLTKVLCTPYEALTEWALAVTKFKGVLYINEVETDVARQDREDRTESHTENIYWGYKFEQYVCADAIGALPDPSGVVNSNEAFYSVVRTRLANHRLLFSGEVDCRLKDRDAPPAPACYLELKTSAVSRTDKQRSKFNRFKLLKWWAQSFLLGVPRVVAGFRNDDGVVVSVRTYRTAEIPRLVRDEPLPWTPAVCVNFCNEFLSYVKRVVTEDNPHVVYLFSRKSRSDLTYSVHRDSPYSFLPDWYVREME
ncbi:decapping and exoribonuclease protein-like [Syngnathoides biaculeatus]|uniref:decapping and exoribonuclease protein-like n=1 Tax=Syngnathoides biaculeatus TaxID=300417 RepID=UPI002ADE4525|nr:decapping and exoribonuclease protein-like [Syngnathoides biaculeatus]